MAPMAAAQLQQDARSGFLGAQASLKVPTLAAFTVFTTLPPSQLRSAVSFRALRQHGAVGHPRRLTRLACQLADQYPASKQPPRPVARA